MTERGKRRLIVWLPVLVCFVGIMAVSVFWLQEYRQSAFTHISRFCEVLIKNNPGNSRETEMQVLSAVKEYCELGKLGTEEQEIEERTDERGTEGIQGIEEINEIQGNLLLTQYGYKSSDFGGEWGWHLLVPAAALCLTIAGCFLAVFVYWDRRSQRRIAELTSYLEQVNRGAAGTVMQTKEDEFSHLQDAIYKTVTELSQTREAAVQAKINFADNLANIAHQLKTPITAASLSLQLMEAEAPSYRVEQMKRQLERLSSLEEALLTLSKIDAGTLPLERARVDVYTAFNLAAENLSDLLREESVSVAIPDKGCVEITGDMEWTMEALMNLIKNCMEHSPVGGTVHCDYSQNPLYAELLIWDEGEGFCQEDMPHLFERFYRGKRASENGIGIGLSLAKAIFALQNGNLTARNLPEGGACFEIRIYSH